MKKHYNAALLFVAVLMFQVNVFAQKEHGSKSADDSQSVELSFYKTTVDPITSETVDYFVELKNKSGKPRAFRIDGVLLSCEGATQGSPNVKFEILDKDGAQLKLIKTSGNQTAQFIVRTTKLELNKTSWSCIEINAKSESSPKQNFASIIIKQLNPGASNFK